MIGTSIGRFRIVEKIDEGAMASVWRAEDSLGRRTVALKLLHAAHLRSPKARLRFLREARLAAELEHHPGIAAVLDADESAGFLYIAFAFVEGETIAARLGRGPLPLGESVRIAASAADALDFAHAHGIVHRDVSPRNLLLASDGRVVVLDFGLALVTGASRITGSDEVLGTLLYSAPEMVMGHTADARSDVYALAAVLYEMLTGRPPFPVPPGATARLCHAILNEAPVPPSSLRPDLPLDLERILAQALAKDPAARPPSAAALAAALRGAALPPPRRSGDAPSPPTSLLDPEAPVAHGPCVVVLPFEDASAGEDPGEGRVSFARGMAEALSASLSRLSGIRIVPPRRDDGVPDLGGAPHLVLRGTIRRSGTELRVAYSIVDPTSGVQRSGDTVDGRLTDVFELEDRLVARIARSLGFEPGGLPREVRRPRADPAAREHYLRALGYLQRYDHQASVEGAIRLLERLIESEEDSGYLHAALARACLHEYRLTAEPRWEARAASECERALAADPRSPEVLVTLGEIHTGTGRYAEAVRAFRQALALESDRVEGWLGLSIALEHDGRFDEAEGAARAALERRPALWSTHNRLGILHFRRGRYREAAACWEEVTRLSPENARGFYNRGGALYQLGQFDEALECFRRSIAIDPTPTAYSSAGSALFALQRVEESLEAFETAIAQRRGDPTLWGNLGTACASLAGRESRRDEALDMAILLMQERLARNPQDAEGWMRMAGWLSMRGREAEAREALARWQSLGSNDVREMAWAGVMLACLGDRSEALRWLAAARQAGYSSRLLAIEPALAPFRNDPEFQRLLETGLPSYEGVSTFPSPSSGGGS